MNERKRELVQLLAEEYNNMEENHALLKELFGGTNKAILEAEMDEHLGYYKHSLQVVIAVSRSFHKLFKTSSKTLSLRSEERTLALILGFFDKVET